MSTLLFIAQPRVGCISEYVIEPRQAGAGHDGCKCVSAHAMLIVVLVRSRVVQQWQIAVTELSTAPLSPVAPSAQGQWNCQPGMGMDMGRSAQSEGQSAAAAAAAAVNTVLATLSLPSLSSLLSSPRLAFCMKAEKDEH
jgi:tellurite resistance protein TehA-like permease